MQQHPDQKESSRPAVWLLFALLSALFAALTAVLAKAGVDGVPPNLATAIRTIIVLAMAWVMVFCTGEQTGLSAIPARSWWFLILSGLSTGASWLFYFQALQTGPVSRVAPIDKLSIVLTVVLAFIFLREQITWKTAFGCLLIAAGTLLMAV